MPDDVAIVSNNVAAVIAAAEAAVREINLRTAELGAQVTQNEIQNGPKTGRVYHVRGGEHQASAPGEAPAILMGDLFAGITHGPDPDDGPLSAKWESTDPKSHLLEFGRADGHIAPRPFMAPAAALVLPEHARLIAEALANVLNR